MLCQWTIIHVALQIRTCHYWAWATTCTGCSHFSSGHICFLSSAYASNCVFDWSISLIKIFNLVQAVLRALYAYFADRPLDEVPHIEVIAKTVSIFLLSLLPRKRWKGKSMLICAFHFFWLLKKVEREKQQKKEKEKKKRLCFPYSSWNIVKMNEDNLFSGAYVNRIIKNCYFF